MSEYSQMQADGIYKLESYAKSTDNSDNCGATFGQKSPQR